MEFLLKGFVFHKVVTKQREKIILLDPRKAAIELPDEKANTLVKTILSSYKADGNMAYARIIKDSWFDTKLRKFHSLTLGFYDFSIDALDQLKRELEKAPLATGGFLTLIDYLFDDSPHLMVVLIKNDKGIGINSDMDLEEIDTLDVDKLHFAADIDIARWLNADKEGEPLLSHVSFLKGKNRKDTVVGYFKALLGIDEEAYHDPSKHTQQLVNTIKNYCEQHKSEEEALSIRRRVQEWAEERAKHEQSITLLEVANQLEPGSPQAFMNFIQEKKLEIPAEFTPVIKHLKPLLKYRVQGPNKEYTLSFEQAALENKTIYLSDNGDLIITKVPEQIKSSIPKL
jgi:nucleoid-associated protein